MQSNTEKNKLSENAASGTKNDKKEDTTPKREVQQAKVIEESKSQAIGANQKIKATHDPPNSQR